MTGYLTFNGATGAIIVQGMPICSDRPIADALRAAAAFKIDVQPEAWNAQRGEWVTLETIE
jgi:hypothetical protein